MASISPFGVWIGNGRHGDFSGERQPDSSAADFGTSGFGEQSRSLVRDADEYANRTRQRAFSLRGYACAEVLRHGESPGSANVLYGGRVHAGVAGGSVKP